MKTIKTCLIATAIMLFGLNFQAQITVNDTLDIETLTNEFLIGNGILISNLEYTGSEVQIGGFSGNPDSLGINSGMIMSTDWCGNIAVGSGNGVPNDESVFGDDDLLAIANLVPELIGQNFSVSYINDVSILEFDFIPYGDSLAFNYMFGSDEYLEWVNTTFNDAFGFFLSGPGIEGPYSSPDGFPDGAINIAFVPDTDPELPITVSSVNNYINSEYYIDNFSNEGLFIDGYTTVLTAYANGLQVGETYHIKLAIGDGADTALESIVMLEAGSFTAYTTVEPNSPGDFDGDGDLDIEDLLILLADLECEGECVGDLDGDMMVNIDDILFFLSLF